MILQEFPEQAERMKQYGRRNVSWSTVAPTGTVSLMTQTTSGLEPLFLPYYIRKKKINPSEVGVRIDFTDANGDNWQEYPILHPKFKDWIEINGYKYTEHKVTPDIDTLSKEGVQFLFEKSPWFGSTANDIPWETRIKINQVIQKYTSNSLSCTVNLPRDVSKEVVHSIYMGAWKAGLKGITIYREGSRDGVLTSDSTKLTNCDEFGYTDAIKRPKELEADYHYVTSNGKNYAVFVGKINNNPYEVFVFEDPIKYDNVNGKIVKVDSGVYSFVSPNYIVENLQLTKDHIDEKLLTRWVSLLLRHGANPKFIIEQVDKSEVHIVSFAKAISRVLKSYVPDEETGEQCPQCDAYAMIYQEGCKSCKNCGYSKC